MFRELQGALNIIGLSRAASVIDGCLNYVQDVLIDQGRPVEWQAMDTFADAITIVEYYLEQFNSDSADSQDEVLAAAEESIQALLHNALAQQQPSEPSLGSDPEIHAQPEEVLEELADLDSPERIDNPEPISSLERDDSLEPISSPEPAEIDSPPEHDEPPVDTESIEIVIEEAEEVRKTGQNFAPMARSPSAKRTAHRYSSCIPHPQGQWPHGRRRGYW